MPHQIDKITDHVSAAEGRLLWQYRVEDTDLKTLIGLHATRTQALEDIICQVLTERALLPNTVGGDVLDAIGERSGVPRPAGLADDKYKALILSAIGSYISYGRHEDVLNILGVLGANDVFLKDNYPACIIINYDVAGIPVSFLTPTEIKEIIEQATAPICINIAGVTANPFVFFGDPDGGGFDDGEFSIGS